MERLRLPHPPFPSCFSQPRFSLAPPPSRCTAGAARISWSAPLHRAGGARPATAWLLPARHRSSRREEHPGAYGERCARDPNLARGGGVGTDVAWQGLTSRGSCGKRCCSHPWTPPRAMASLPSPGSTLTCLLACDPCPVQPVQPVHQGCPVQLSTSKTYIKHIYVHQYSCTHVGSGLMYTYSSCCTAVYSCTAVQPGLRQTPSRQRDKSPAPVGLHGWNQSYRHLLQKPVY